MYIAREPIVGPSTIEYVLRDIRGENRANHGKSGVNGLFNPPAHLCTVINKKTLLLRYIHHFKSDLINNTDQMCISGTKTSSVILSRKK